MNVTSRASKVVVAKGKFVENARETSSTSLYKTAIPPPLEDRGKERSLYPGGVNCLILASCRPSGLNHVSVKNTRSRPISKIKSEIASVFWFGQADPALNKHEEKMLESVSPIDDWEQEFLEITDRSDTLGDVNKDAEAKGSVGVGGDGGGGVVVVGGVASGDEGAVVVVGSSGDEG